MKLFSPSENKDLQASELARNLLRAQESQKIIKDTNERLSKSQADFELSLASQKARWETEEREYKEWKTKTLKETEELEEKKKKLLIPVEALKKEVADELKEAQDIVLRAKNKEELAEELQNKLENKLDELGYREEDVKRKEKLLDLREKNIEGGEDVFKAQQNTINKELANLAVKKAEQDSYFQQKDEELKNKEASISSREESLDRTDRKLSEWQRRLEDERGVLDANWQELLRKGGNIPIQYKDKK